MERFNNTSDSNLVLVPTFASTLTVLGISTKRFCVSQKGGQDSPIRICHGDKMVKYREELYPAFLFQNQDFAMRICKYVIISTNSFENR